MIWKTQRGIHKVLGSTKCKNAEAKVGRNKYVVKRKQYPAVALTERLGGHMWLYWQYLQNIQIIQVNKKPSASSDSHICIQLNLKKSEKWINKADLRKGVEQ